MYILHIYTNIPTDMPTQHDSYTLTYKCTNLPDIHKHPTYTGCAEIQHSHLPTQNYT